jgi:pectin methylesterase-like acyl-CoA thioesterase
MNSIPLEFVDPSFGPPALAVEFSVSPGGSADFRTIGEALRAAETRLAAAAHRSINTREPRRIHITLDSGIYREKLAIRLPRGATSPASGAIRAGLHS